MDHLGDTDAIIRKDLLATELLHLVMLAVDPPCRERALVLPDLMGQQQVFPRQAPEPLDRQAAARRLKGGLQRSGEVEILIPMPFPGLNFKEQADHGSPSAT